MRRANICEERGSGIDEVVSQAEMFQLPAPEFFLRRRFAISDENYSMISRVISDTVEAGLIKLTDPTNTSRRHASYVPFWA